MDVDVRVADLAFAFIKDVLKNSGRTAFTFAEIEALTMRTAQAMQRAIEDECKAIEQELLAESGQ